jgi:hypothetical protein
MGAYARKASRPYGHLAPRHGQARAAFQTGTCNARTFAKCLLCSLFCLVSPSFSGLVPRQWQTFSAGKEVQRVEEDTKATVLVPEFANAISPPGLPYHAKYMCVGATPDHTSVKNMISARNEIVSAMHEMIIAKSAVHRVLYRCNDSPLLISPCTCTPTLDYRDRRTNRSLGLNLS